MMRIVLLLVVLLEACIPPKNTSSNPTNANAGSENQIVFVVLRIQRDTIIGRNVIEVVSKTRTEGKLKKPLPNRSDFSDFLTIDQYQNQHLVNSTIIEHPLYKRQEFLDENKKLAAKNIAIQKADFFVRLQLKGDSNDLRISETLDKKLNQTFTTIKL